ncbi:hypothetical protein [Acidihalobacter prosperus]|uniref:Uncharacterized protein n=1 Tax=Acidihalobacter prosperus TaxID=160660 RepID=A0A1A6C320_9GAMM|nr:hypothetical protein [Acidihalobacter prosperus]OBS08958.1 hypothetical protein Thpro_022075 [Acidihalobacter prosperus]
MNTENTIDFVSYRKRPEVRSRVLTRRHEQLRKENPELAEKHDRLLEAIFEDPEVQTFCEENDI